MKKYWLAVSTHFKHININHHGNLPQSRGEHQKYLKPPPRVYIISQVSQFAPTLNWGNYINYSIYGQIYISMGKHVEKIHENVINIQETSLQILRYHSDPFGSQIVFPPRNETSQSPSIIQIRGIQIVNSPLKLLPWQEEGVGWWVVGSVGWLDGPFPIKKNLWTLKVPIIWLLRLGFASSALETTKIQNITPRPNGGFFLKWWWIPVNRIR